MNATRILAVSALSLFAVVGVAQADEADGSQMAVKVQSTRARADVRAEAMNPVKITNGSTGVHATGSQSVSREQVRNDAAVALRAGQIQSGELDTTATM